MQKTLIIISFLLGSYTSSFSQVRTIPNEIFKTVKKEKDTARWHWKRGGVANFNLSQGSLSNWAAGGDNFSLSLNAFFNYYFLYKKNNHTWDNNIDFNHGFIQTSTSGLRKNDDRFDLLSKYGWKVDSTEKLYLSGLFNLRTQIFDGRTYSNNTSQLVSTFFSPAYIIGSIGVDYKPIRRFSAFISPFTSRTTVVANNFLSDKGKFGVPAGKHALSSIGAFASINYDKPIGKSIFYKGRMDLFADYKKQLKHTDLYMTNVVNFKINQYFSATYNLDLICDNDVTITTKEGLKKSAGLQIKSLIGIGLALKMKTVTDIKRNT